ncbi:hypothetical protein M406DRAFT_97997 [Cryphonectria parasitica EP155]|uniref:F-box domain-containing protein n=1 Tax=Cryphonectria parasitica (strain ATCC 38755 / EP155) TaxID=660469 RepID=A0A9P4Y7X7_CRYP1|nr:uncharacterized protein M406DRAFT_97997 [Cryphonectria parasitica EP155]KAF3767730.1 hypothetical protein M406DRAFT_97997 [Cryphonectria parasitica EP155]
MEADTAVEAPQRSPRPLLHFTGLPREIQSAIISNCSRLDLICVSLVSRHFRDLAAAELYRSLQMVFSDEDDFAIDTIERLAKGLETLATSDYNYANHIRDITLDTVLRGEKAEIPYKLTLGVRCVERFLNTLLLLTLRKAKALERLKWSIRVELSRPVYQALHQIDTLTCLYIRMHHGTSSYEAPPPLPLYTPSTSPEVSTTPLPNHDPSIPQPTIILPPPPPYLFHIPPHLLSLPPPPPLPKAPRPRLSKHPVAATSPPTLSGFKNLSSLAILEIDSLEVITELKSCIRNSQGTLKELSLSFSTNLAMRARKPSQEEIDPEDSDPDDEFQVMPVNLPPPVTFDDLSGPARALRAQEERKTQEAVLGRIFDLEPYLVKESAVLKVQEKENEAPKQDERAPPGHEFINSLRAVSSKLMSQLNGSEDFTAAQQDILNVIETAARKYVGEEEAKAAAASKEKGGADGEASGAGVNEEAPKFQAHGQDLDPDDIDVEAPLEDSFTDEPAELDTAEAVNGVGTPASGQAAKQINGVGSTMKDGDATVEDPIPNVSAVVANLDAQRANFKVLSDKLHFFEVEAEELQKEIDRLANAGPEGPDVNKRVKDAEKQTQEFSNSIKDIKHEMSVVAAGIEDAEKQMPNATGTGDSDTLRQRINEYARSTRGLSLETLSIYLIPVKRSVLSRAIDLRVLQSITLLGVGNQAPIWSLFAKENQLHPLPLRKVFTDNVSLTFLTFLFQLPELHELYMLERSRKFKPESFAPPSNVSIAQIRRIVLKKHLGTLKRLMINCQAGWQWDMDSKTAYLLCTQGSALEELAISSGIREVHIFLQHIQHLTKLRALHIINLRNDDTCVWVMRETKRFIIDALTHLPKLKIEWLAIDEDDTVEHMFRWREPRKGKKQNANAKGKEKASLTTQPSPPPLPLNGDPFPVLTLDDPGVVSDSEEDDESDGRIVTDSVPFYAAWDIKIFNKEIVQGQL